MSTLMLFTLIWVACGYGSIAYALVTGWWQGEDATLQDLVMCGLVAPFAGGILLLFVAADLLKGITGRIDRWLKKETVIIKGRSKR